MRNKNPSPNPDIKFVDGKFTIKFHTVGNKAVFTLVKDGETKEFSPIEYLNLILGWYYHEADGIKSVRKQLKCIVNAESHIRREIIGYKLRSLGYDFSEIFEDIDITTRRLTLYNAPYEKRINNIIIGGIAIISAISGAVLTWYLSDRKESSVNTVKIQVVQDTIGMQPKDTSKLTKTAFIKIEY